MIPIEATLDHNTGIDAVITGAAHIDLTPPIEVTTINLTATHHINHITVLHNIKALQVIDPEIVVGHIHNHPTGV